MSPPPPTTSPFVDLMCMGRSLYCFLQLGTISVICNLLFDSMDNTTFPNEDQLLKQSSKFFPLRVDPIGKGTKKENHIVVSLDNVSLHLNVGLPLKQQMRFLRQQMSWAHSLHLLLKKRKNILTYTLS